MIDCLGNKIRKGDLIVFAATWDRSAIMKMAIVLDAEKLRVMSAERFGDTWSVLSKPGTLKHPNKTLRISGDMLKSSDAAETYIRLQLKVKELNVL